MCKLFRNHIVLSYYLLRAMLSDGDDVPIVWDMLTRTSTTTIRYDVIIRCVELIFHGDMVQLGRCVQYAVCSIGFVLR